MALASCIPFWSNPFVRFAMLDKWNVNLIQRKLISFTRRKQFYFNLSRIILKIARKHWDWIRFAPFQMESEREWIEICEIVLAFFPFNKHENDVDQSINVMVLKSDTSFYFLQLFPSPRSSSFRSWIAFRLFHFCRAFEPRKTGYSPWAVNFALIWFCSPFFFVFFFSR